MAPLTLAIDGYILISKLCDGIGSNLVTELQSTKSVNERGF